MKRFRPKKLKDCDGDWFATGVEEHQDGDYVLHSDYAALEASLGYGVMMDKKIHDAIVQQKNDHIKRLEDAIRVLLENLKAGPFLVCIQQGTTAEELLECERDALRLEVARIKEKSARYLQDIGAFSAENMELKVKIDQFKEISTDQSMSILQLRAELAALKATVSAAKNQVQMMRREIPKTIGGVNISLLMEDLAEVDRLIVSEGADNCQGEG